MYIINQKQTLSILHTENHDPKTLSAWTYNLRLFAKKTLEKKEFLGDRKSFVIIEAAKIFIMFVVSSECLSF